MHEFGITRFYSSVGLQGASPVADADVLRLLDKMPNLRALDLRKTDATSAVMPRIARLDKLQWLWLDAAHCTDANVGQLHGMGSLRRLAIDRTNLSDESLAALRSALPKCVINTRDPVLGSGNSAESRKAI